MSDGEVESIMRTLAENVQTYDQVTEVRVVSFLPPLLVHVFPSFSHSYHLNIKVCYLSVSVFSINKKSSETLLLSFSTNCVLIP